MKKIIASILLASCVLSAAACGNSADTSASNAAQDTTAQESKTLTQAEKYYNLAKEGDIEGAYYSLLITSREGDTQAAELLADFSVGYAKYTYKDKDKVETTIEHTYNDKGFLIKVEEKIGNEKNTYEYTYNDRGDVATMKKINEFGKVNLTEYEYNDAGVLVKDTLTNPQGNKTINNYTYNDAGKLIKTETLRYGKVEQTGEYTYDDKGNLQKELHNYLDSETNEWTEYTYNDKGQVASKTVKDKEGKKTTYEFFYDSIGNIINEFITGSRNRKDERKYTYDDKGNRTAVEYIYYDGETEKGTYEGYKVYFKG